MANKKQLSYGSSGEDVKNLQLRLNETGNYNLETDGVFGSNTQAAVKDYQQKNGLATDGIVGNQTWSSLDNSGAKPATKNTTPTQQSTTATTQSTQPAYTGYQQSDTVAQAQQMLHDYMAQKPGEYQSTWQGQLDEIMAQIMNRQPFQYDVNSDALYQQYKDQYMAQGQQAMMDTMGQAAALTGGYGNSYAQTAGQQTYQGYLQQLNDKIPDLYQLALSKYQMEGNALADQYAMLGAREDQDYGRWRDSVGDYYTELNRLYSQYNTERDYDYGQYIDDRNYQYQVGRDTVADQQWQTQYDEAVRQWQAEFDENQRRYDQEWEKANGNGSAVNDDSGNGGGGYPYSEDNKKLQQMLVDAGYDIAVDGYWGPESIAAYADYLSKLEEDGGYEDDILPPTNANILSLGYGPIDAQKIMELQDQGIVGSRVVNGRIELYLIKKPNNSPIVNPFAGGARPY